jgi:hypothetical protein
MLFGWEEWWARVLTLLRGMATRGSGYPDAISSAVGMSAQMVRVGATIHSSFPKVGEEVFWKFIVKN